MMDFAFKIWICIDRDGEADLLREIFGAYCSFGDAMSMSELSLPKFLKLLQDCKVIDNSTVRRADVDIAYTTVLKVRVFFTFCFAFSS